MAYYPTSTEFGARYTLTAPDGTIAVFNDPLDPNYVGMLTEVTGLDSSDIRESADELVQADGGVHGDFWFGRRPIVMSGLVHAHATVKARDLRLDIARRASNCMRADGTLVWKPSTRLENWVTNPRFANDTASWSTTTPSAFLTSGGTLTRNAGANTYLGGNGFGSLAVTASGHGAAIPLTNPSGSWVAGKTYTALVRVRTASSTRAVKVGLGTTSDLAVSASQNATSAGGWVTVNWTPAATTAGTVYLGIRADASYSDNLLIDAAQAGPSTYVGSYVDGASGNGFWRSTAHASISGDYVELYVPVRRQQPFRETGAWNKAFQIPLVCQYAMLFSSVTRSLSGGTSQVCENRGSAPTYPLVTVTGAASNPQITDGHGGTLFTTGLTIGGGQSVTFDLFNHTAVWQDGTSANQYINFTSTTVWPYMQTGNNTIGTSSGTIAVTWRDAWV